MDKMINVALIEENKALKLKLLITIEENEVLVKENMALKGEIVPLDHTSD